jgi:hypothetical protein
LDGPSRQQHALWVYGSSNSTMSVLATSCDGGRHACNTDAGYGCAAGETCTEEAPCSLAVGSYQIGTCGTQPVHCP